MTDNLFLGLPPPSNPTNSDDAEAPPVEESTSAPVPLRSALKSALKRSDPPQSQPEEGGSKKRLRFKTTTDATTAQVIEAMQKIASHIKNPSKFSKASKLALQLIQAGSIKDDTSDLFFSILEASMSSPEACASPLLRAGYQELFSNAQDVKESFNEKQKNQLMTWTMKVVVGNDLYTDDSFVFSKAAGKIKEAISSLPPTTEEEDNEEAALQEKVDNTMRKGHNDEVQDGKNTASNPQPDIEEGTSDPFGLDALLPVGSNKDEKVKAKKDGSAHKQKTDSNEEFKRFLKSQREVLIFCLETAARRYKTPWAQTVIDILVKHAYDNVGKFTLQQRDAIEKLWNSIREQQIRRKQGKSVSGKLDMNAFEHLQEKYANEKISIRHSVGGSGERRAQQWLG